MKTCCGKRFSATPACANSSTKRSETIRIVYNCIPCTIHVACACISSIFCTPNTGGPKECLRRGLSSTFPKTSCCRKRMKKASWLQSMMKLDETATAAGSNHSDKKEFKRCDEKGEVSKVTTSLAHYQNLSSKHPVNRWRSTLAMGHLISGKWCAGAPAVQWKCIVHGKEESRWFGTTTNKAYKNRQGGPACCSITITASLFNRHAILLD